MTIQGDTTMGLGPEIGYVQQGADLVA